MGSSDPYKPEHFINRELSWLEFNQRVLDEALDRNNPLLERLKFFCIVSSNIDEFFEIRVAGLKQQAESGIAERSVDGLTPSETLRAITKRVRELVRDQYSFWQRDLRPALAKHGIRFHAIPELGKADQEFLEHYYRSTVRPVLTPIAIDPAHAFPLLVNKSLNVIVQLDVAFSGQPIPQCAVVQLPRVLPRLVQLPHGAGTHDYVFLGHLIRCYLADLFPGVQIQGAWLFRITRNSDLYIDPEEVSNLLKAVEAELHNRRKGAAVRLEIEPDCPPPLRQMLLERLDLTEEDVYEVDGPLEPSGLLQIYGGEHSPELRDPPFVAPVAAPLRGEDDLFAAIRKNDILLHHPYESFESIVSLLQTAARDPRVLAIKQTLYRTGTDGRITNALVDAVRNGKHVTAVVELRARFDEAKNVEWAHRLEEEGVNVVYGLVGYKIHAKVCLIVRWDEDDRIRRYVHLSTGNYNPQTAKLYTDLGLLTCQPEFGEDATDLFNLLTGICQFRPLRKLLVAPFDLHQRLLELIEREIDNAEKGLPARIIAKMNSLVDEQIITALYRASQAGVEIELIVRGICCLRPGIKEISRRIRVRSIVDRFLEHSRIFYFENACQPEVYLGSADWMPRNFFRRVETVFPIEDGKLRDRLISEILAVTLADNVKARLLRPDGTYRLRRRKPGEPAHRSQVEFMELARTGRKTPGPKPVTDKGYPKVELAPPPWKKKPSA